MTDVKSQRKSPKIFVCDDDEMVRVLARECLEEAGMEVVEAADGIEALSAFTREKADLIFLDVDQEQSSQSNFKWATKAQPAPGVSESVAEAKTDASVSRHRWILRNDADQARHRWILRNDADQARHRWILRNDTDQARHRWILRNDADQARHRWILR